MFGYSEARVKKTVAAQKDIVEDTCLHWKLRRSSNPGQSNPAMKGYGYVY